MEELQEERPHTQKWGGVTENSDCGRHGVLVLDNGSYAVKAGFAGQVSPLVTAPNCGVQPFGRRQAGSAANIGVPASCANSTPHTLGHHGAPSAWSSAGGLSGAGQGLLTGDDIYSVTEYFCVRPFNYGLLLDAELQTRIWEKIFYSKQMLNIPVSDLCDMSLLVTEHFNSPASLRHTLTQIVFEEFQFDRMVISPGQLLVPYAFLNATFSTEAKTVSNVPNETTADQRGYKPTRSSKKTMQTAAGVPGVSKNTFHALGDIAKVSTDPFYSSSLAPQCQLVVDIGHQTMWAVPMYGELPLEAAVMRVDLGGAHVSTLLKNLLSYRQVDLERHELLVHHVKEESCFASLNYLADLRLARGSIPFSSASAKRYPTHLTHRYILPDITVREAFKNKQFFKTRRPAQLPRYISDSTTNPHGQEAHDTDNPHLNLTPSPIANDVLDFLTLNNDSIENENSLDASEVVNAWQDKGATENYVTQSVFTRTRTPETDLATIYLNVERIKPAELLFCPLDYDSLTTVNTSSHHGYSASSLASSTAQPGGTVSALASASGSGISHSTCSRDVFTKNGNSTMALHISNGHSTNTSHSSLTQTASASQQAVGGVANNTSLLRPPDPCKQCGIAEAVERAIFACPPVLQASMAQRILLCGGSSSLPNFARRLYIELRSRLPESWPIVIYQQVDASRTIWEGGSAWASTSYDGFALTRAQYLEAR